MEIKKERWRDNRRVIHDHTMLHVLIANDDKTLTKHEGFKMLACWWWWW